MLCTIDRLSHLELLSLLFHFPTKLFQLLSSSTLTNPSTVWIRNTLSTVIVKLHEPAAILNCAKQTHKVHTWGWKEFLRVHHPTRGSRSKREKKLVRSWLSWEILIDDMITESSGTTARARTIDLETLQLQSDTIRQTKLQCEVETCALLSVVKTKTRSLDSNLQ